MDLPGLVIAAGAASAVAIYIDTLVRRRRRRRYRCHAPRATKG